MDIKVLKVELQAVLFGFDAGTVRRQPFGGRDRADWFFTIFIPTMRNTTKLKQILLKYNIDLSMDDESILTLTLVDKISGQLVQFEHSSYSQLLTKSHSYFMKELKSETKPNREKPTPG